MIKQAHTTLCHVAAVLLFSLTVGGVPALGWAETAFYDGENTGNVAAEVTVDEHLGEGNGAVSEALADDTESLVAASGDSNPLMAQVMHSGTCGGCSWSIDSNGRFHVWPTNGNTGRLVNSGDPWADFFPWREYREEIKSVVFDSGVLLPFDCSYMFKGCVNLQSIDVSDWDTSSVTDMRFMFSDCISLTMIDVSDWDTSSVMDMQYVFCDCPLLTMIDVSDWDTSSVTDMGYMFYDCSSLSSLDVSSWDTSQVTDMGCMFYGCSSLTSLDLSGWDTSSVTTMGAMFYACKKLARISVGSQWSTDTVATSRVMFDGCESLKGGNGTTYSSSHTDASYAVVDAPGVPGYLTAASKDETITDMSHASVAGLTDQVFTGRAIKPPVTVRIGSKTLVAGTDYSVVYRDNTKVGVATVTVIGRGSYTGSKSVTFRIVVATQEMHRLYNPNSGEHFYTASAQEKDALVKRGWKYEGVGWVAPVASETPVYRLYNANAGDHHYTTSERERDALVARGWKYEAIGWYSDDAKGTPLYRQYNPNAVAGSHNYTTSTKERDALVNRYGWHDEGIGWYGMKQ